MAHSIGATLSLKNGNFFSNIKSATSATGSFKSALAGATNTLKSHSAQASSTGMSLKSLAKSALGLVAAYASFSTVKNFLSDSIKAAQNAEQANVRLNTIMDQIPGITEKAKASIASYSKELSKETTIGATAQKMGASQLASFQMSADSIAKLMPQLNNLAVAQYGVNVSSDQMIQAANMLGKAYSGQTGALSRAGIVMTDAQAKMIKTGNDAQKSAALVEILNQNFGDLAKEMANTNEGRIVRLHNAIAGIKSTVGTALLPIVTTFMEYVTSKLPAIQSAVENTMNFATPIISSAFEKMVGAAEWLGPVLMGAVKNWQAVATAVAPVVAAIGTYKGMVGAVNVLQNICNATLGLSATEMSGMSVAELAAASAKGIHTAATGALTTAQNLLNAAFIASPIGWIVVGIAAVTAGVILLYKKSETFRNFVNGFFSKVVGWAKSAWEGIKSSLAPVVNSMQNAFTEAWELIKVVWDYVSPYFKMVWTNIKAVFGVVQAVIGGAFTVAWTIIKAVWNAATGYFKAVWDTIAGIFGVVRSVLTGDWQGAWNGIKGIVNTWASYFSGVWQSIKSIFGAVGSWFGGIFTAAVTAIKTAFSSVVGFFQGIWNSIKSMFTKIGTAIADGVSGAFKSVINSVIGFAGRLINNFIGSINWAIDKINYIIPGVTIPKLQEVSLPQLWKGGTAISAGSALVGERGPEIIDMPKGASVIPLDKARRDGDSYDYTTKNYNITVNINAENKSTDEIVNEFVPKLKLALSNI